MPIQCRPHSFAFQECQHRRVTAVYDGNSLRSNAGTGLLRVADRYIAFADRSRTCASRAIGIPA